MADTSARSVKALRDKTGAGMMDCKRALADAGGDLEKAVDLLRERGLAKAAKRGGRATTEGAIAVCLAGAQAGIIELGCETDFVARTDEFEQLASGLAELVAARPELGDAAALLDAEIDGEKVRDRISAVIGKLGENIDLKRAERLAVESGGRLGGYVHAGGKLGVLVGLRSAAAGAEVDALAKDLAMHVAAADPTPMAVNRDGISPEALERESAIYRKQAEQSGKPEKVIEKIVEGRLAKFYRDVCLVDQAFVKDPDRSVGQLLKEASKRLGREVAVTGFVRFKLGEDAQP